MNTDENAAKPLQERLIVVRNIAKSRLAYLHGRLEKFSKFINIIEKDDLFDRKLFRDIRRSTMSQADWADMVGVSQGTIGNWERGVTDPNSYYRSKVLKATREVYEQQKQVFDGINDTLGIKFKLDPVKAKKNLMNRY